jgi:hypothetical protein
VIHSSRLDHNGVKNGASQGGIPFHGGVNVLGRIQLGIDRFSNVFVRRPNLQRRGVLAFRQDNMFHSRSARNHQPHVRYLAEFKKNLGGKGFAAGALVKGIEDDEKTRNLTCLTLKDSGDIFGLCEPCFPFPLIFIVEILYFFSENRLSV